MIRPTPMPKFRASSSAKKTLPSPADAYFASLWQQLTATHGASAMTLGITSAQPREGVTTVAANLAIRAASETERGVLLVEANFRSPQLASMFQLHANPGMADILRDEADLNDGIQTTAHERLSVLTAGSDVQATPWSIAGLSRLLGDLRERFPVVFFDMAPVHELNPCLGLVDQFDGLILVVEAGRVNADQVQHAKQRLESSQARLLGVVLNKIAATNS